jgi:hypothetical protein
VKNDEKKAKFYHHRFYRFVLGPAFCAPGDQGEYELEFILKGKIGSENKREELFF